MSSDRLKKHWAEVAVLLQAVHDDLRKQIHSSQFWEDLLNEAEGYLKHNELGMALETLEDMVDASDERIKKAWSLIDGYEEEEGEDGGIWEAMEVDE